jgi:hypothetical protein
VLVSYEVKCKPLWGSKTNTLFKNISKNIVGQVSRNPLHVWISPATFASKMAGITVSRRNMNHSSPTYTLWICVSTTSQQGRYTDHSAAQWYPGDELSLSLLDHTTWELICFKLIFHALFMQRTNMASITQKDSCKNTTSNGLSS